MAVYLVQHAESKPKEEDSERTLTDEGFNNAARMASYAKENLGLKLNIIYHSGKLRAKQTAEVFEKYLGSASGLEETDGLEPMANPRIWADRLSGDDDIMLVGHLPHLGKLAGVLLSSNENINPINFQNAGIVRLFRDDGDKWKIDWIVVPTII